MLIYYYNGFEEFEMFNYVIFLYHVT